MGLTDWKNRKVEKNRKVSPLAPLARRAIGLDWYFLVERLYAQPSGIPNAKSYHTTSKIRPIHLVSDPKTTNNPSSFSQTTRVGHIPIVKQKKERQVVYKCAIRIN